MDLHRDRKEMEAKIVTKIEWMRRDIVIWLGGLIVAAVTALGVLMKLV